MAKITIEVEAQDTSIETAETTVNDLMVAIVGLAGIIEKQIGFDFIAQLYEQRKAKEIQDIKDIKDALEEPEEDSFVDEELSEDFKAGFKTAMENRGTCEWSEMDEFSTHKTGCGNEFQLMAGDVADNKFTHCMYCGGEITQGGCYVETGYEQAGETNE